MSEQVKSDPPAIKKENSYTYWVDESNRSRELPHEHRPKKVSPPPLTTPNSVGTGPSKWNTLGSWEQRSVPMKQLNQNIEREVRELIGQRQLELVLSEVSLEGQFKQIFSNNKRKVLYEITGKLKFEGEDLQLGLEEMTCSGDQHYRVKGKKAEEKAVVESLGKDLVELITQIFNRYKE